MKSKALICTRCNLHMTRKNVVWGSGPINSKVKLIGEAPGANEDEAGSPFCGRTGIYLTGTLIRLSGLKEIRKLIFVSNMLMCFISPKIRIYTQNGCKQIKDVVVGDMVLTHKGKFRKVLSRIHDLPIKDRMNKGLLIDLELTFEKSNYKRNNPHVKFTVTENHKFLVNNTWVMAKDLKKKMKLKALGERCKICGNLYFKHIANYDNTENTCSQKCHNISVASSPQSKDKLRQVMKEQYRTGIRDRYKITREANKAFRKKLKTGWRRTHTKAEIEKREIDVAISIQGYEKINPKAGGRIGHGEHYFAEYLKQQKISFISQFAIKTLNYDFMLPNSKKIIEIDNYQQKYPKAQKKNKVRDEIAAENGYEVIRISSKTPIKDFKRIWKNHENKYEFVDITITKFSKRKQRRQEYLYCLEVEGDESFIAGGIISHNCRPPGNRNPTEEEVKACGIYLRYKLNHYKPRVVGCIGKIAATHLIGPEFEWNGEYKDYGITYIPVFHPSYVMRQPNHKDVVESFEYGLRKILSKGGL